MPKPLPFIISSVAPSSAIGDQMAGPIACIGTETSPTLAPSLPKTAAALRTLASTSFSEL